MCRLRKRLLQIGHQLTRAQPARFRAEPPVFLALQPRRGWKGPKRAHKRTNCLLCEDHPSEPDVDYALYGLGVQECFVKAFHLGCLFHSLLKMNAQDEQPWRDIHCIRPGCFILPRDDRSAGLQSNRRLVWQKLQRLGTEDDKVFERYPPKKSAKGDGDEESRVDEDDGWDGEDGGVEYEDVARLQPFDWE